MTPIESIMSTLKKHEVTVPQSEVEKRYNLLVDAFKIKPDAAVKSTANFFLKEAGVAPANKGPKKTVKVDEIAYGGMWIELDAKVVKLKEPKNPAISQTGVLADETGTIWFTKWAKAGKLPNVQEGKSYHFDGLASDEYNGRCSVKISKATKIAELDHDIQAVEYQGDTIEAKIADITEVGQWLNVEAKCVQLFDPSSDSIAQTGLLSDETGTMKFTKWAKANLKEKFEEGKSYRIENVIADEYNGRFSIKLNKNSVIKELDKDIESSYSETEFYGNIVNISPSSGIIKRCETCKAVVQKGVCKAHGKVKSTLDLRVMGNIDNGLAVQSFLLKRQETEALLGKSMDALQEEVREAMDNSIVVTEIEGKLLGRYATMKGIQMDDLMIANSVEVI